jgi:hypothetical protein
MECVFTVSQIDRLALPIEHRERVVLVHSRTLNIRWKIFCGSDEIRTWGTRGKAVKAKDLRPVGHGSPKGLVYTYTKNYFTETKRYFSRNETKQNDIFLEPKPKRNKYFSETKRNETKKNYFFNPWLRLSTASPEVLGSKPG